MGYEENNNGLKLLCDVKNILGECPYYKNGDISFVDIIGKKIIVFNKEIKKINFNEKIGSAIPLEDDGFLICAESGLFIYKNNEIKEYKKLKNIIKDGMRINDAKVDGLGRLWFSIMVDDGINEPNGALYCLKNNELLLMQDNVKLGNGLAFSNDFKYFYYIDSILKELYVYDFDLKNCIIKNKKVLHKFDEATPDGMTIDLNDNLFIALWGGGRVEVRSNKTGELLDFIKIPTKLVTSCTFSGVNYDELIITTASLNQNDEYAGKVFKLKTKYKGKKENYYKI